MVGSTQSFRIQLTTLLPRLRRFGHALTGNTDDADDVVQAALEKALKRERQFQPGTRLDSWMFRIMQTTWIDMTRSQRVRSSRAGTMEEASFAVGEDGRSSFIARIQLSETRRAMQAMPDEYSAALALVAIEGFTYKEAAEMLDVPIGTIMSRVSRGRQAIIAAVNGKATHSGEPS